MTSGKKIAVSLLIATVFLAVCTLAGYAGFFSVIETRFYRSARIKFIQERLERVSDDFESNLDENSARFKQFALTQGIVNSFDDIQTDADIKSRSDIAGAMLTEAPGLRGIRLVADDGTRIHYSTFAGDFFQNDIDQISYTIYSALGEMPYTDVAASPNAGYRLVFDAQHGNIVFAFPVFDRETSYRGTLLFYLDAYKFSEQLVLKDSIDIADRPALTANGIVFGLPAAGRDLLTKEIDRRSTPNVYANGEALLEIAGTVWLLFSSGAGNYGSINWVYPEDFFVLPPVMRFILLGCVFITVFLVLFLCLNIKHDAEAINRERIRKLNTELVDALLKKNRDEIFESLDKQTVESPAPPQAAENPEKIKSAEKLEEIGSMDKIEILEEFEMEDDPDGLIELTNTELDTSLFYTVDLFSPNVELIELYENPDIIVEHDGLYTIPKQAPLAEVEQDKDFKTLVESVMR